MSPQKLTKRQINALIKISVLVMTIVVTWLAQTFSTINQEPPVSTVLVQTEIAHVARVIDGDTIVLSDGRKVRYIGIDAPELHDSDPSKNCFGNEATTANKNLVEGKDVTLTKDTSETDRYGRLLRYLTIDHLDIGDELVKNGFARAKDYPPDSAHKANLKALEKTAQQNNLGLWRQCRQAN